MIEAERRARHQARMAARRRQQLFAAGGFMVALAVIVLAVRGLGARGGAESEHEDLSQRFEEVGRFLEVHLISGSVVATVDPGGVEDPGGACRALLVRLEDELDPGGTVTLFDVEGRTLADCGGE